MRGEVRGRDLGMPRRPCQGKAPLGISRHVRIGESQRREGPMGVGTRGIMQAIAAATMALGLAACSTSSSSAPPAGTAQSSPSFGQKVENMLLLGDANPPPAKTLEEQDKTKVFCPELAIQPGTAS